MIRIVCIILACLFFTSTAEARQRHATTGLHPMCNVLWPCEKPYASSARATREMRGKYVARELGFGGPRYPVKQKSIVRHVERHTAVIRPIRLAAHNAATILEHPAGCPRSAFCACGAAVHLLGSARAAPWLARAWYNFQRAAAAPHMAGVRPHHVVALEYQVAGNLWMVYDANSGGHATRLHVIDISRYTIVDPHSG